MVKTTNVEVRRFPPEMNCLVETQEAIPGLPDHLVVSHILRSLTIPQISHGSQR
jgi:hypothetical protein